MSLRLATLSKEKVDAVIAGEKESIPNLLESITPLAQQLNNNNILDCIPRLKKIMGVN